MLQTRGCCALTDIREANHELHQCEIRLASAALCISAVCCHRTFPVPSAAVTRRRCLKTPCAQGNVSGGRTDASGCRAAETVMLFPIPAPCPMLLGEGGFSAALRVQNTTQQNVQAETCLQSVTVQFASAFLSVLLCTYPTWLQ